MLNASSAQHDEILLVFDMTIIDNKIIQQNFSYDTVWEDKKIWMQADQQVTPLLTQPVPTDT